MFVLFRAAMADLSKMDAHMFISKMGARRGNTNRAKVSSPLYSNNRYLFEIKRMMPHEVSSWTGSTLLTSALTIDFE